MARIAEGLPMAGSTTTVTTQRKKKPIEAKALTTEVQMLAGADVWGRAAFGRSWLRSLVGASPLFLAPMASISIFITLAEYEGSLSLFADAVKEHGFWTICAQYGPHITAKGIAAVICFVGIQALLYCFLPGEQHQGQLTPAGYLLSYKINGLSAWIATHLLYAALSWLGILDPGFIPRNWSSLIGAMNLAGFVISALALVKAYVMPTHPEDRKFSGSFLYDFFMGIELNPRLGENFDLKLFSNGRAGMMVWTLIDFSNMAYQYQNQGYVEPSLILVTALQTIYVVDFFVNESWYLRTIDVKFDHYGFYLSWGCFCFLPTTYTIQGQYLGRYPSSASTPYLAFFFALGVAGYIIFRSVNHQKEIVRRTGGKCIIWGKPAECIVASFRTSDGRQHRSLLLCSGWWGWSRHANYLGDLILSFCSCALLLQAVSAMERHNQIMQDIADKIRDFCKLRQPYRIFHSSWSSTRARHGSDSNIIDISMLSQVISVDTAQRACLVEPNVPMDRLVEATMPYDLTPPVVMEFPGITAGGGFAGTSGESSSFRHGFFNETVDFVKMILGNGDIIRASREEHEDPFHGAAGAAGTLGLTTLMQVRLVEAKRFVKTAYRRVDSVSTAIAVTKQCCENVDVNYVEGVLYSKDHGVVITCELTNAKPDDCPTEHLSPSATVTEYIPLGEYLFRYDRAAFWVGRQGHVYFKIVPFNKFSRWLLDDYSRTRTLHHALHASRISDKFVVQDLALPYHTAEAFVDWVDAELGIWPLWLCPLKGCRIPTFHPVTKGSSDTGAGNDVSQPMLNIGVWRWRPSDREGFKVKNQALERKLMELGGRKWLYALTYYTKEQFWDLHERLWYERLRERYFATILPTVYDKVERSGLDAGGRNEKGWGLRSLLNKWLIGGIYGMILAFYSQSPSASEMESKKPYLPTLNFTDSPFKQFTIPQDWRAWEVAWLYRLPAIITNDKVPARLIENGCIVDNVTNCHKACGSEEHMFSSPETLWNCLTLATVAMMSTNRGPDTISNQTLEEVDRRLNTGPLDEFWRLGALLSYVKCALQSCSDSKFGGCPPELWTFQCQMLTSKNIKDLGRIMSTEYCDKADPGIDYDIAGPGAIASTLVDLQEAQAVFLGTISIAAIITFSSSSGTGLGNISSLLSWLTNNLTVRGMVSAGMYPLLFVQLILQKTHNRWWYTLALVFINWVLVVLNARPQTVDEPSLLRHFNETSLLERCGNRTGPRTFCQTFNKAAERGSSSTTGEELGHLDRDAESFFKFHSRIQAPMHVVMAFLILDWILAMMRMHLFERGSWLSHKAHALMDSLPSSLKSLYTQKHFVLFAEAMWISMEALTIVMGAIGVHEFAAFMHLLSGGESGSESKVALSKWGFGQLVAVCVWVPVILKFACLMVDGALPGWRKRLGQFIEITQRKETETDENDVVMETLLPSRPTKRGQTDEVEGRTLTARRSWGKTYD
ncbi:7-dehydrocholesterol reductase [Fusarium pseudocircinatum]|uniref:Delta(24)-sterol reductase n=1 Tax=Fusarium pseudocircinatum TaxID=56676 RepID=A0A8H5NU63_9HYPO|nr:7-dehydrocholesterol reductase [Fusarium pseudocircinatum]